MRRSTTFAASSTSAPNQPIRRRSLSFNMERQTQTQTSTQRDHLTYTEKENTYSADKHTESAQKGTGQSGQIQKAGGGSLRDGIVRNEALRRSVAAIESLSAALDAANAEKKVLCIHTYM
jgi:hypothetical protein